MIIISENLVLKPITINHHLELYELMLRIYPPAYYDYWKDKGKWYVDTVYSFQNFQQEINDKNSDYLFVVLNNKNIGILRFVSNLNTNYQKDTDYVKLHRLYLDQQIQNQGIGKKLMDWLLDFTTQKGYKKLWLEVMEKQLQALHFYKKYNFKEVEKVFIEFPLVFDEYRGMFKMVKELN